MGAGRKLGEGLNTQNQEVGLNPHEMDLSPFLSLSLSLPLSFTLSPFLFPSISPRRP